MWDQPQRVLGSDRIITSLVKGKQRAEDCIQKYVYDHFFSDGHNGLINDVEIVFIAETV